MKSLVIFLAAIAYAAGAPGTRSISSSVVDSIEAIKEQMPCGFPHLGIPILAPLKIPHKAVDVDEDFFRINGEINNFVLNGLNHFEVLEMRVNALTSTIKFHIVFSNVNVDTTYDVVLFLKKFGITLDLVGTGPAKFAIKDMQIRGVIKYKLGLVSRKLKLKTLELRTSIGSVASKIEGLLGAGLVNRKLNDALEKLVPVVVNENEDLITGTIENLALPIINGVLGEMTLSELIAIIVGDGETETPACNADSFLIQ